MTSDDSNSEEQKSAEADVESFHADLGPFVVAAETTRMPMVFTDACQEDNPVIFANDAFLDLTGYTREEVLSQSIDFVMANDDDDDEARALIREEFKRQLDTDSEVRCRRKDGSELWATLFVSPVRDEDGDIIQYFASFIDLTAYKEELAHSRIRRDEVVLAQKATERLSQQLLDTFESIRDAIMTIDREWRIVMVNSEGARLLGLGKSELVGKVIWDLFPEEVGSTFSDKYHHAMSAGVVVRFTEWSRVLSKWFNISVFPWAEGLSIYFYDVTDTRDEEMQLRLLETAISRITDVVIITDASTAKKAVDASIVFVNDAFAKETGYSRAEVIGKSPRMLQGPKTQRDQLDRIRAAISSEQSVKVELINYTKTGKEFWNEVDLAPIRDDAGTLTHYVSIQRNISDRKEAEAEARLNLERFKLAAKATTDVIWDWDVENDIIWWSGAMEQVYLHPQDRDTKTRGDLWRGRLHPEDQDRVSEGLMGVVNGEGSRWEDEYRFIRGDGTIAEVLDRGFVMREEDGQAVRVIGSMTDLSRQRDLEARLRQSQRMEAVGQLTGGIAHDFNNLLTIMMGNAEILADELEDQPDLQKLAAITLSAADRGAELINGLLAFSRKQALEPQVLNPEQLIQGMDGLLRRTLPENINIDFVRAGGLWKIEVDASQLESALLNLVLNARDAMPNGGFLTIETANTALDDGYVAQEYDVASGQYVMICVTDTGHGIPPDVVGRVFEPFFTTKEVGLGSGLGLSMVYGFVKQSGGHIRVYSEQGEGTSFKLYFPRSLAKDEQVQIDRVGQTIVGGNEMILVVEDDSLVREYVTAQLKGLGYLVIEAPAGVQALEMVNQDPGIDLLFTDVVMPGGMGGRELADAARALRPDLKILFTSGYTDNAMFHNGRLDAGVDLLSKPYRRDQLASTVRKVLDQD